VFAEDVVPGDCLVEFVERVADEVPFCVRVWVVYGHGYSFIFWSCHFVCCVLEKESCRMFSGTEYGRLVLSKQSKPRSLGGAGDLKGKTWNYSVSNAQNVQANGYKMDPLLPLLTSMRKCFLKTFHSLIGSRAFAPQLTPASCITCS
jgi:hypothetical protein